MATFEAQVEGLTSIAIESSGTAPTQSELTQFLTDGAKEILNTLPRSKQSLFTTANELNGRIRDSDDMMAATVTDPAYYVTNNILVVVPSPTNAQNAHVHTLNYPTVAFGDSAIAKFPDDAEYLVPIYGAIKSLQNAIETIRALSNTQFDSAVTQNAAEDTELASSHINAGNAYLSEIISMEKQQAKLQTDYDKGIQALK